MATEREGIARRTGRGMRAVRCSRYGLDALELAELEVPAPNDDGLLIRVHASSVNPADWYRVTGPLFARLFGGGLLNPKSDGVGIDLAGRVEAVGKHVEGFQPGDEVFGTSARAWAEYAPARGVRLVRKPAGISFEEAAAAPVAALTALQALRDRGGVQPGQKVLINGASGGVGTYAVQLAKALGADVTAVCSTRNVDLARSLGADRVVDYTNEDFTRLGERHELMLDIAGSRPLREVRRVLTRDATVVVVGAKFPASKGLGPLAHVLRMRLASLGRSEKVVFFVAKINTADLDLLAELLEAGTVRSVIDRRFELSDVHEALRYLGEGHARGKVTISMRPAPPAGPAAG